MVHELRLAEQTARLVALPTRQQCSAGRSQPIGELLEGIASVASMAVMLQAHDYDCGKRVEICSDFSQFAGGGLVMENASWDVESAGSGETSIFLQPLDHSIPMVATAGIGHMALIFCWENWRSGVRLLELEDPRRDSANDFTSGF